MPAAELLRSAWVELEIPLDVVVGQPGVRVTCQRCGEEILNGREAFIDGRPCCRGCAGESYWRLLAAPPYPSG